MDGFRAGRGRVMAAIGLVEKPFLAPLLDWLILNYANILDSMYQLNDMPNHNCQPLGYKHCLPTPSERIIDMREKS